MKIIQILILSIFATSAIATGGYHKHKSHKPVVIDKTKTIVKVIDKTQTKVINNTKVIDKTTTVQQTIDNTVTNDHYNTIDNTVTEQYYNTVNNTSQYENVFDDDRIYGGMAMLGAMANIPALSKNSKKDIGIGVGVGNYVNKTAFALGLVGVHNDLSYKGTFSYDGDELMTGAGMTFGF